MITKAEARKVMLAVKGTTERLYFNRPSVFHAKASRPRA